jgi:hypothetical protein
MYLDDDRMEEHDNNFRKLEADLKMLKMQRKNSNATPTDGNNISTD